MSRHFYEKIGDNLKHKNAPIETILQSLHDYAPNGIFEVISNKVVSQNN